MNRDDVVELIIGKKGLPTLRVGISTPCYLHSLYDPISEAACIVEGWTIHKNATELIVVGLGLGYHIRECLLKYPMVLRITVIEWNPNVLRIARDVAPDLFENEKVHMLFADDELKLRKYIGLYPVSDYCFHPASIDCMPYEDVRSLIQEMQILRFSNASSIPKLNHNFRENMSLFKTENILSNLQGIWVNRPGVVVAAGPSLSESIPFLNMLREKGSVQLAVTRTLRTLLDHGVMPTAFVATESDSVLAKHFEDVSDDTIFPPLLALPTVHPKVIHQYPGPVKWVFQRNFTYSEDFAEEHKIDTFSTGGSVATLALSLLHYFGCDPIIFVGQDLAFVDDKSHADEGSINPSKARKTLETVSVKNTNIRTTLSWNAFRHWIEHYIETHPERTYYNASEGAHIRGTIVASLPSIIDRLRCDKVNPGFPTWEELLAFL